jgi:hypothetical protein
MPSPPGQIPSLGPIRSALAVALIQTPHRFRTQRQLWAYSGLALETRTSGEHRYVRGQLRRSKKQIFIRGLNKEHNHKKPSFRQNQFGASVGGPVEIPRLYNGKKKTFFFFAYQGFRYSLTGTSIFRSSGNSLFGARTDVSSSGRRPSTSSTPLFMGNLAAT